MTTTDLIRAVRAGDEEAKTRLVTENMGLIWSIVKRFYGRGYESEDLFQIGSVGLIKAIDRFDLELGLQFSTYAVPLITGEIKRFLRDDGMVKVSRSIKEKGAKMYQARERLLKELGREPSVAELAVATDMSDEDIFIAMEGNADVESLQEKIYAGDDGEISLEERLADNSDEQEKMLNHMFIEELLKSLSEDERKLIHLRYFKDYTQAVTAEVLGVSQVQVSRMEKKILHKLRSQSQIQI